MVLMVPTPTRRLPSHRLPTRRLATHVLLTMARSKDYLTINTNLVSFINFVRKFSFQKELKWAQLFLKKDFSLRILLWSIIRKIGGPTQYQIYRTHAIISRDLYIFYSILKSISLLLRTFFRKFCTYVYGQYSRAVCNQEQVIMAHVRYQS